MSVYLSTIVVILMVGYFFSVHERKTGEAQRLRFIVIASVLLALQSGLRNVAVGDDTFAYYNLFETVRFFRWSWIWEDVGNYYFRGLGKDPGYEVVEKLIQYLLPNYQLFLLLIAGIFFTALGHFIYRNTELLSDAVLAYVLYSCLFFLFFSITGQRQTLATAAALYGFEFIKSRKWYFFFPLILVASSIHRSVLIFLPFYFLASFRRTGLYMATMLLLFPLLMLYRQELSTAITEFGHYQEYSFYHEKTGTYTFTAMLLILAIVALWRMKAVVAQHEYVRRFYNAFVIAIFLTPLTWVNPSNMRAVQYYSIFLLVLVPPVVNSLEVESRGLRRLAYVVSILVLVILLVRSNIHAEYKFFWQKMALGPMY